MSLQSLQTYNSSSSDVPATEQNLRIEDSESKTLKLTKKAQAKKIVQEARAKKCSNILFQCNCEPNCSNKVSKDAQNVANRDYWSKDFRGKKSFILSNVSRSLPNVHRVSPSNTGYDKMHSYKYKLKDDANEKVIVCRTFFLNSLGYDKSNSRLIYRCFPSNNQDAAKDNRGSHARDQNIRKEMEDHIKSFNPSIAHYRRAHAPQRLYLPSDLSATKMYENFRKGREGLKGKYVLYTQILKNLNISFAKLGCEECEVCDVFKKHETKLSHTRHDLPNEDGCISCDGWWEHIQKAGAARQAYKQDKEKVSVINPVFAVDLQKVNLNNFLVF